jgi:hypothetical protein
MNRPYHYDKHNTLQYTAKLCINVSLKWFVNVVVTGKTYQLSLERHYEAVYSNKTIVVWYWASQIQYCFIYRQNIIWNNIWYSSGINGGYGYGV